MIRNKVGITRLWKKREKGCWGSWLSSLSQVLLLFLRSGLLRSWLFRPTINIWRVQGQLMGGIWGAPLSSRLCQVQGHDILGQLSKVTKFGLCCFSIFSFQCVMRTFWGHQKWFFGWAVSSSFWELEASFPTENFDDGILLCGVTRQQLCWSSGQKWFKYSCFLGGKGSQ